MIKKLLFITFLLITTVGFSQKTLEKLSAAPNPFTKTTTISFESKSSQTIIFSVKNILGRKVYYRTFLAKKGRNTIPFSKNNLQSGIYIYTILTHKETVSKRLVIR